MTPLLWISGLAASFALAAGVGYGMRALLDWSDRLHRRRLVRRLLEESLRLRQ